MTDRTGIARYRDQRRRVLRMAVAVATLVLLASACINNGAWSAAPAPVTPVQGAYTPMADVSCVTEDWCLAVGQMDLYPLAQVWDGTTWSVITAPSLGNEDNTAAERVECGTTTSCVARVRRSNPSPTIYDDAVAWDGEAWHVLAGGDGPYIDPVPFSCASDGTCLVFDNAFHETVVWDGESATRLDVGPGWDVNAMECFSADLCVAATSYTIAIWNGTAWSEVPGSDSFPIFVEGASSFACSAVDDCLAVGLNAAETGPTSATWDGAAWTEVALPAGVTSARSLECVGDLECLVQVSGSTGMLAWTGGAWRSAPAAPGIWGFSCQPLWCLGVGGSGSPVTPHAATYEWTNP